MTELTDDAVKTLLAHYDLPTDCDCDGDDCVKCSHYPTFQERASKQLKDAAPDLARALIASDAARKLAEERLAKAPYIQTGVMDKDGREICVGDRIMIDLESPYTKREYWRPEYEVVFQPPHFTIKHVGGDKDSSTAHFYWEVPQKSSTAKITTIARALLDARAELARLRADAQATNGVWQANLRLQAELAETQTQLVDWIVRADEANVTAEKAEAELAAAQQREAGLSDPISVHVNMLRGTIAKPTIEQIIHLYGVDALCRALVPMIVREAGNEQA